MKLVLCCVTGIHSRTKFCSIRTLLSNAKEVERARHVEKPRLSEWYDTTGRLLVVGEAANTVNVRLPTVYFVSFVAYGTGLLLAW